MTDRNTQFAGFARAVVDEIMSQCEGVIDGSDWFLGRAKLVISQRAYDLVWHTLEENEEAEPVSAVIGYISDLPELPAEPQPTLEKKRNRRRA